MLKTFVLVGCLALCLQAATSAQQVGDNINVLPVYKTSDDRIDEFDFLRGDLYGQRQSEPAVVVSTVNKDHILAFYNDLRAVDVPDDPPLPGLLATITDPLWNGARILFAKLLGLPEPTRRQPPALAGVEAGVGMSVSYDGGLTWTGGFVPGLSFDPSPASLAAPAHDEVEGGSDPVAVAAPCGRFYLVWLAFNRTIGESSLRVTILQDLNNSDVEHTIKVLYTTEIDRALNSDFGLFVDKPEASLTLTGESDCSAITEELNVTYTTFSGKDKAGNFQSRIHFAKSFDQARTFEITKVDDNYTDVSGTATLVHPTRNDIYVFFRSFNSPDSIILRKSTTNGTRWLKPVDLLNGKPPMAKYDQPTVTTGDSPFGTSIKDELAPRTNAFPTAAFTPDGGTLMVAWQERVGPTGSPDPSKAPRIVMIYSKDGGDTWSERLVVANNHPPSPAGQGFFNPNGFPVGPQVMPRLSCGPGNPNQCLVTYYESRPYAAPWSNPVNPSDVNPATGLSADGFAGGYDRVVDLRGVLIDAPIASPPVIHESFQISRYSYRTLLENETPQETVDLVESICPPGADCYAALNYSGYAQYGGGSSSFMGDYNANKPMVEYVKDSDTAPWRVATSAADGPSAFITAFTDNRNVVRPFEDWNHGLLPAGTDWQAFPIYGPAGLGGSCWNPGSRDQNVMVANVSFDLLVTAPTTFKPYPPNDGESQIEFPMTLWNNTGQDRRFDLRITDNPQASFAKEESMDGSYPFPLQDGAVIVLAHSSSSINVYAFDGNRVTVNVTECDLENCGPIPDPLTGSIAFNAPSSTPPAGAPSPTYTAAAIAVNPVPRNPVPRNPVPRNPVPRNTLPDDTTVYDIIDYSWTVTPNSQDDAGTYLALPSIDKAYQDDYIFQVFVTKPSTLFAVNGCDPANLALGTLVGHISDPRNPVPRNPIPRNPIPRNPVPRNPVPRNAPLSDITLVQNSTFTLATTTTSGSGTFTALGATSVEPCDPVTGGGLIGKCTLAAPRLLNEVTVTVRAYQITENPIRVWDPYGDLGTATTPSVTVADYWCTSSNEGCPFAQDGPELAAPDPPTADVDPTTVRAGQTVTFPLSPVTITNVGNQTAQEHRMGYYISAADTVSGLPRNVDGTIDTTSATVYTQLLDTVAAAPVAPEGGTELVSPLVLTIPVDIPRPNNGEGTYYLYAYVDDLRVVSELDEDNNFIQGGPITVQAPGYSGILGLFTPCHGLTCERNAGPSLPFAFQLTFDGTTPVDSLSTQPRLKIFAPLGGGACLMDPDVNDNWLFLADPTDVSSGSSLWQYFDASCLPIGSTACSRDAFTHQYNWQTRDPDTGQDLAPGCYTVVIEVEATGQIIGSELGPVETVEVTLR